MTHKRMDNNTLYSKLTIHLPRWAIRASNKLRRHKEE